MPCEAIVESKKDDRPKPYFPHEEWWKLEMKLEKLLKKKKRKREEKKKKKKGKLPESDIDAGLDPHPTDCNNNNNKKKKKKGLTESESDNETIRSLRDKIALMRLRRRLDGGPPTFRVGPSSKDNKHFHTICQCSNLAIAKYNTDNGTNYEFIHYVRGEYIHVGRFEYTITFEARQPSDVVDKLTVFKAKAYKGFADSEPKLRECRLVDE